MADVFVIKVDGSGVGQTTAGTCWLASYKMLMRAAGRPEGGIAADIRNANLPYDDFYQNGLPIDQYEAVRDALKLQSFRASYLTALVDDAAGFITFLRTRGPFWCSIRRKGNLHIILVNGYDGVLKQVRALNPWNNVIGGEADTMFIPFSDFKSWVTTEIASCQVHPAWPPVPADQK